MKPSILFENLGLGMVNKQTVIHQHHFWQLEIFLGDGVELLSPHKRLPLKANSFLIIPPNIEHGFYYSEKGTDFISIKFHWPWKSFDDIKIINDEGPLEQLSNVFLTYFDEKIPKEFRDKMLISLIQHIFLHLEENKKSSTQTMSQKVLSYLEQLNGKRIKIDDLAKELGFSVSHLSREFRRENACSLKSFIDQNTYEVAKKLLEYSDFNISEIAGELLFPDVYSFSHFFKKFSGSSPSEYKKK